MHYELQKKPQSPQQSASKKQTMMMKTEDSKQNQSSLPYDFFENILQSQLWIFNSLVICVWFFLFIPVAMTPKPDFSNLKHPTIYL